VQFQPFTVFHRQRPFGKRPYGPCTVPTAAAWRTAWTQVGARASSLQMEIRHRRLLVQQGHKGGHRMALRRADLARHGGRRANSASWLCA
jgi:hypothetical protein